MAEYIERTEELVLAINAGARAIEHTWRYYGAVYTKDWFADNSQKISYLRAANVLLEASDAPAADVAPVVHERWRESGSLLECQSCGDGTFSEHDSDLERRKYMKVYIAGRITGDPRYREKFAEAEAALREVGHIPLNPAVLPEGMEAEDYMRICTAMLDSADAIGLLGDWTDSPGAQLELHYANYVGKKTVDLWKMLAVRRSTEVRSTEVREENVGRVPADTDPALIAALRCSATVGGDKDCASCAYGCRVGDHMPPEVQVLLRVLADEPDCDCDRIALDAAQRLEELTEVRTNEKHK